MKFRTELMFRRLFTACHTGKAFRSMVYVLLHKHLRVYILGHSLESFEWQSNQLGRRKDGLAPHMLRNSTTQHVIQETRDQNKGRRQDLHIEVLCDRSQREIHGALSAPESKQGLE